MKTPPPPSNPPLAVRIARSIRHARGLNAMEPIWNVLRTPYHGLLRLISHDQGLPLNIQGVGVVRVPPSFLTGEVDALEVPMLQRMVSAILPDTCFYDIGASIGLHSLVAGQRLAAAGEIHAFEPDLPSCAVYWSNMELVRRRVKVHLSKTFVSDISTLDDTEALCLFPIELTGASQSLGQGRHLYLFEEGTNRLIPRVSIDAYVRAGARPPSVIKCDIEGAELLFLRGAVETLRLLKPALFVSLHPALIGHFGYGEKEFFDFLRSLNYSWEILNSVGECHVFANASKNESNGNQCVK